MTAQAFYQSARELAQLPAPGAEEQAHSARLASLIAGEIERDGPMPFSRFMEMALYQPGLGYYASGLRKFGEQGDFITAPELTPLFAMTLAQQLAPILRETHGDVLEFGAGSGRLAVDLLRALNKLEALPERYSILELSAELRHRQQQTLAAELPQLAERVHWLDALPEAGFRGVMLANEVLDAMPVELFRTDSGAVCELYVALTDSGFAFSEKPAGAELAKRVDALNLAQDYRSEINRRGEAWISELAGILEQGMILLIDYGFPQQEYYMPERSGGTLMCHYRHRSHVDPLILPGLQDITAHVDFTAMAESAFAAGLSVSGYTSQASFLLSLGLLDALQSRRGSDRQTLLDAQAVKKLIMPQEMGELFKVMALTRDIALPLAGFTLQDQRFRL